MSKNTRWALAIVGVVVIVIAAIVIGTGKDDTAATPTEPSTERPAGHAGESSATSATGATATTPPKHGHDTNGSQTGGASPSDQSGGAAPNQESGGAKAQTGVVSPLLTTDNPRTVKAQKGDLVVIRARADKPATLHVHGYDKMIELKANEIGRLKFKATIDGEFEIEMHYAGSAAEVGTLRVSP